MHRLHRKKGGSQQSTVIDPRWWFKPWVRVGCWVLQRAGFDGMDRPERFEDDVEDALGNVPDQKTLVLVRLSV
jgi:hypothetical protein